MVSYGSWIGFWYREILDVRRTTEVTTSSKFRAIRQRMSKNFRRLRLVKQINRDVSWTRQIVLNSTIEQLKGRARYQEAKRLFRRGAKIYSQNAEDGMLHEIFERIGTTNKTFVEFGCGDGLENNTLALVLAEWRGLWIDSSSRAITNIQNHFGSVMKTGRLAVVESLITRENINQLIAGNLELKTEEIDLLSIDIDGNDAHVFNAINVIRPRVVVIEYNAKFPPPIQFSVEYDADHVWQGDDYVGASLSYLEKLFAGKGYSLVGCDLVGVNAFFVRDNLVEGLFSEPLTAENHYEPFRSYLSGRLSGPVTSYSSIGKILSATVKLSSADDCYPFAQLGRRQSTSIKS
jgi:hypothetical protein